MEIRSSLRKRGAELALAFYRWRGDPLAALVGSAAQEDPYPLYARVRTQLLYESPLGVFATANHETAAAVLRDPRFSSSPSHEPGYRPPSYPPGDERAELTGLDSSLLTMDPPDHTRIRRLVSSAFTARAIAGLEDFVRETALALLDRIEASGAFDLIDSFAFPLPIAVICHILGVPVADEARFRVWGHDAASTLEPRLGELDPALVASELELTRYLRELIARRRREPDETLLSKLITAEEEGDRLSSEELVATALLILVAGFETTVNLIGNGTSALVSAPGAWGELRDEPGRCAGAIEELLRFDSPVQLTSRVATEDVELAGRALTRGKSVVVLIGGANRDPAMFSDPDRLVIGRPGAERHLSFSLGAHHCLGAALARLEGRVAFEELTKRYGSLEPAGAAKRRPLRVLRGFEHLPLRERRRARNPV